MYPIILGLLSLAPAETPVKPSGHEATNPLYKELLEPGLSLGSEFKAKLPAPTMTDGLDSEAQKIIIKKVIGTDYTYEAFTRQSVVAPHVLRINNITPSDPKAPARSVDTWFVAYGNFGNADDQSAIDRFSNAGKDGGKNDGKVLTKADLAKRKIEFTDADEKRERFANIRIDFLEKVQIQATGRVMWSKGDDSVIIAAMIDPRFAGDAEFPNQWLPLSKGAGKLSSGSASPYGGAGFYMKVTKLAEPAGALFIEQHVVFTEPTKWFEGANLLRSKFPLVVQSQVRSLRRELIKEVAANNK
ncbi:hypothetical protein [Zavarzinella formosa]|uniref:hypothetical protein n=1 Tax=Zavarzinella formosa TaxID=360055 RepID=UPI000309A8F3|nr:hypothetical protein [Zavarzinella formosa]